MFAVLIVAPFRVIFKCPTYCFSSMCSDVLPRRSGRNENVRVGGFGTRSGVPSGAVRASRKFGWTRECRAASSDLAPVRRSPRSREYAIYKSRAVPEFGVLALEGCMRTSAEPVRRSLQDLMRGHTGTRYRTPAPPTPDARVLATTPGTHSRALTPQRTTVRVLANPLAHRSVRARAPPALEPLHPIAHHSPPLGPCARLRPAQEPLRRRTNTLATAPPARQLRRRPSRCVETVCERRGCCDVRRAAHSGQQLFTDCDASRCSC
jgi:hypothetical protein